ncbi:apolipoprotein M [Thalassophryne amazonica]|uniref:apolipoprotein M n=1 Tax=Thalassophryne amazonica TaxID=390379 RepID=UPI00147182C8|nr:apolipoprotein M [Thalassophryne amazonica]
MLKTVFSYFLSLYSLWQQAIFPCTYPELLPANTVDVHKYLGTWYFKAAVSRREADIQKFRALDSIRFTMEKINNDTLLLTGHMRIGDNCTKQTWIYHIRPDRDDLELEGKPKQQSLLRTGRLANCSECIVVQEIEPPLHQTEAEDSLSRYILYARQKDVKTEVKTFLENNACHHMTKSVTLPQQKEFCK